MFGLGPWELIIVAVIILLLFGAKRLPDIGKGLGGAIREFKKVKKEFTSQEKADETEGSEKESTNKGGTASQEAKITEKVMEQVPGFKKAVKVKEKAEKIKKILE